MPEAVQIFIAPPDPAALRRAARAARHRLRRGDRAAAARPPSRSWRRRTSSPTRRERRPAEGGRRAGGDRPRRAGVTSTLLPPMSMIKPRVDKLLEHTDSHYAAVVVAAKRARQINSYYHTLGEGSFGEYTPPMVEADSGELPHDRPRGARRGQAQVRVPHLGAGALPKEELMARILLGVSGGIAAYKSLELARLATQAGHGVRVLMTPSGAALRRRRLLRGDRRRSGAHRRVRARPDARRLPGRPGARARPDRPSRGGRQRATPTWSRRPRRTRSPSSPPGIADSMLTTSFLACAAPRLVAPAMNDRMYARRRHPGEPRDAARARDRR